MYQEIQQAAEQKMQTITLQDILDLYHKKLETSASEQETGVIP